MLVITHRYPILTRVDKLLVLRSGQVLAQGPRDDLLPRLVNASKPSGGAGEAATDQAVGQPTAAYNRQSAGDSRG